MDPSADPSVKEQFAQAQCRAEGERLERKRWARCKNDVEEVVRVRGQADQEEKMRVLGEDGEHRHGSRRVGQAAASDLLVLVTHHLPMTSLSKVLESPNTTIAPCQWSANG